MAQVLAIKLNLHQGWRLDETVGVRKEDLSVGVQPIAKQVSAEGCRTTVGDLVSRAIVDSDLSTQPLNLSSGTFRSFLAGD